MFLLTAVFDPEDIGEDHPLFVTGLHILDLESYPYHEAIQWLHGQSWRLKTCLYCKKHFVAEHAKTKFCSYGEPEDDDNFTPNCFQAHRRKYQQEYWDECRNRTNERRRQKYQSEKKTKRSRHAKRKTLRQG